MAGVVHIGSLDDPRVAAYRWVADPARLGAEGWFVAEGRMVVPRLLAASARPGRWSGSAASLLLSPAALESLGELVAAYPDVPAYVAPQAVMNALVGFNIHRGCLALAQRPAPIPLTAEALAAANRVVVLEGVNNPDNIGGIFRTAAAFGVDLIVLGPDSGDPLYRKAIRTSMGATLEVPYVSASDWPAALAQLATSGLTVAALTLAGDARPLPGFRPVPSRVALLAGAEGNGLTAAAQAAAHHRLRIPMTDQVDSLNVATAVAVALYHFIEA